MDVDGYEIQCQDSLKYLGVVLDARLIWTPHIKYIAGKTMRAIGVLRALSRLSPPLYSFLSIRGWLGHTSNEAPRCLRLPVGRL